MKRTVLFLFFALILVFLAGCGRQDSAPVPSPEAVPESTPPAAVSTLPAGEAQPSPEPELPEPTPAVDEATINAILELQGEDVSALFDLIGEPLDSSYIPSCLGPGDDGELYYDGFIVATYREDGKEIVWDVIVNDG